ncbi:MAG TPA: hypothetical protein VF582_09370 [Allosphingosinicella sp.]
MEEDERDGDEGRLPDGGARGAEGAGAETPGLPAGPNGELAPLGRVQANKHRELQVTRPGKRKYFDDAAKAVFLEWFAATCNLSMSAAQAGFNYKTVCKHLLTDPAFKAEVEAATRVAVIRLKAKSLETKAPPVIGPEGELDAPDLEIGREEAARLARDLERTLQPGRKHGRTPRVASNAEVEAALTRELARMAARRRPQDGAEREAENGAEREPEGGGEGEP